MEAVAEEDRFEAGFVESIAVWVIYCHFGEMRGDLDNIAKPILDALIGTVWSNDSLISRLTLRRIRVDLPQGTPVLEPPASVQAAFEQAMADGTDFVYIRAEPDTWAGKVL